jgi:hypothetical protein
METPFIRRAAAIMLVVVPLVFTACFTLLSALFEYPDILRQPTADVLAKFAAGGPALLAVWYVLTLTALLFIPLVVLLHRALAPEGASVGLWLATVFGVVAGLVQTLGFIRWPFLVPHLAQVYLDPATSAAGQEAAGLVFEAFHRYAGMALGEHLGYLSTSVWTVLIGQALLGSRVRWMRVLSPLGMILALGIAAGLLEPAGVEVAGAINAVSYLLWAVWLVGVGAALLVPRASTASAPRAAASAV